jgi:hypothetical protein
MLANFPEGSLNLPLDVQPLLLSVFSAHSFSNARACSFDAIPNRASAKINARTLT